MAHTRTMLAAVSHRLKICLTTTICGVKLLGVIVKTPQECVTQVKVTIFSFWSCESQRYRETLWTARLAIHPPSYSVSHIVPFSKLYA